ncbi:hypothetical protein CKO27_09095 [Thiocystis violacea]|nr:hypothetical protein [Thiocystis violacea]
MATVYLARQDRLTRDVALKVMKPIAMAGDDFTSRFVKEGQIIAQLQHPQIVTIYDFDSTDGYHYFSMEYLPGGTLADEIKRGLPVPRALSIARKIAEALAVAHARGVIHRDVKPQNILFRADGTPVLTDFGIARAATRDADSMQLTSYGMVIGSPRYMSPEQSTGQALDPRSDLYSLGVVFHEMLTNRLPYEADDVVSLAMKHCNDPIPRLPEHLTLYQPILDRLIAKKPEDRFASAGQLIRALETMEAATLATGVGDDATRLVTRGDKNPTASQSQPRRSDKRRYLALIGFVLILALAAYIASQRPGTEPDPIEILDQLPPPQPNRPRTVVQYEALAIEHVQRAQFDQGLGILRLGLAISPDDERLKTLQSLIEPRIEAERRLDQARRALSENRLDEALEQVDEGLGLVPRQADLVALKAEIGERIHQRQRLAAERSLELARDARQAGDLDEAMRLTRQGLGLVPDHPELLALQERISGELKQAEDLAGVLRRIEDLINAGQASASQEAIERARLAYPNEPRLLAFEPRIQEITKRQREDRVARLHEEAILRHDRGEYPQSLGLIAEGLGLAPGHPGLTSLRDKVMAAQARERQRQADEILKRARPLFDQGDLVASLALIEEGRRLDPDHKGLSELRARILGHQDQERRIAEGLRDCDARFAPADLDVDASQDAHACYARILSLDPANRETLARIARLAGQVAEAVRARLDGYRLDEAEAALNALRTIDPENPGLAGLNEDLKARREVFPSMVGIAGGCFRMGSPETEAGREPDERPHQVCVEDFRLARFEVSVREFERFVKASGYRTDSETGTGDMKGCEALDRSDTVNPWGMKNWASWRKPNKYQATRDQDPVGCVSWNDTRAFIEWLSRETGHAFRLPTEAEWEYAARASSETARFWGDASDALACRYSNSADKEQGWDVGFPCGDGHEWVAPIGRFQPNPWGLFDMLGNLWEWTCSEYDADYAGAEQLCAPGHIDAPRVMRGGAWNSGPALVRAAYRNRNFPEARYSFIGFRLALDGPVEADPDRSDSAK